MAAIFMLVATFLITVGGKLISTANQQSKRNQVALGMAQNAAKAGLVDAKSWFIRQNKTVASASSFGPEPSPQPTYTAGVSYVDQAFNPTYNGASPALGDSLNATIGIVNEFSSEGAGSPSEGTSSDQIWERYEVYKASNPMATPGQTPNPDGAKDVTGERVDQKYNGQGLAWDVVSVGYVYKRMSFTKNASGTDWLVPYNKSPNVVLATAKMSTEFRKLSMNPPFSAGAALYTEYLNSVSITGGTSSRVYAQNPPYYSGAGVSLSSSVTSKCSGGFGCKPTPTVTTSLSCPQPKGATSQCYNGGSYCAPLSLASELTDQYVFGMSVTNIPAIADFQGDASNPLTFGGLWKLYYYNGDLTIDPASAVTQYRSVDAYGVLVVNGSLTITSNATTINSFNGVIYVTGNMALNGGVVDGQVIMGYTGPATTTAGNVLVTSGGTGVMGGISYDPNISTNAANVVGVYREDTAQKRLLLNLPNL